MRELVISSSTAEELSVEERNLLSVAYKNVIGSRRAAWRTLNAGVDEGKYDDLLLAYRKQVESELSDVCLDVLNLLEETLVKNNTKENEARVFYLKVRIGTHHAPRCSAQCWGPVAALTSFRYVCVCCFLLPDDRRLLPLPGRVRD